MKTNKTTILLFWLLIGIILTCGIWMHTYLNCNTDANWLLVATQRLLHGGRYYYDFFETNPPMILYLNIPAVLTAQLLNISLTTIFQTYVFVLAIFSLIPCYYLLTKLFEKEQSLSPYILLTTIAFVFFVFPAHAFGEREHLALILTLPYFLLAALRIENKATPMILICIIGIMAGLGFSIKPHFIFPFVFVELYLMIKKRNFFAWLRPETLLIMGIATLYITSIFVLTPEYINKVLPLACNFYYASAHYSFYIILSTPGVILFLIATGCFFAFHNIIRNKHLAVILLIASVGFILSYFAQQSGWFYHILPAYALSIVLMMQILLDVLHQKTSAITITAQIKKYATTIFILSFIIIFAIILPYKTLTFYHQYQKNKSTNNIINYINNNTPNHRMLLLDTAITIPYSTNNYIHAQSISRFPSQLLIPGLIKRLAQTKSPQEKAKLLKYKHEIIQMFINDLQKKPDLIIIDISKYKAFFYEKHFNYIQFYSQNAKFKQMFNSYNHIKNAKIHFLYHNKDQRIRLYAIYKRKGLK